MKTLLLDFLPCTHPQFTFFLATLTSMCCARAFCVVSHTNTLTTNVIARNVHDIVLRADVQPICSPTRSALMTGRCMTQRMHTNNAVRGNASLVASSPVPRASQLFAAKAMS